MHIVDTFYIFVRRIFFRFPTALFLDNKYFASKYLKNNFLLFFIFS